MKTIIAGSRSLTGGLGRAHVFAAMAECGWTPTEVVSGAAAGIDTAGEQWADLQGIDVRRFPADWDKHGRAAGPIRNAEMAAYADALVLIWDGASRGSQSMHREARKAGLRIHQVVVDMAA